MRVALIDAGAYTPPYDHRLAAALAARGHEVTLLTAPFRFGEAPEPVGYRRQELFFPLSSSLFSRAPRSRARLPLKALEYGPSMRRARRRLETLAPDIVHVQWLFRPDLDIRWLRAVAAKRPIVFTAHDLGGMLTRRREAWRRVLETVDRIVVHSRRGVHELADFGILEARIARIPHPVFDSAAPVGGGGRPGQTLLFFGLIRAYKGVDLLLRALPLVAQDRPDVRLVVAGDPLDSVEPLRRLANELGVAERVVWRLGFLPDDEVEDVLADASVVVLPYRRRVDASGVLALAVGHGVPIVASDVGSLGETVEEFGAGEVVPAEDIEALAAACIRLLGDDARRDEAVRGAARAREALTWEAAARQHEALYEALVHDRARPGESLP
ncbi:MAG: glycosyltransferase [Actinobacteria bacterium]|nr:MAG: glycosyltransferase [Actinomycetota bacterium]